MPTHAVNHNAPSDIMSAIWLVEKETDHLYIVPRQQDGFEAIGPDDTVIDMLNQKSDVFLGDSVALADIGFAAIPEFLRRYDSEDEFFYVA